MATTTPNIGLTLPSGTEGWKRSVINGNFTILDTKIGAVGNTPLQTQINTLSSQLAVAPATFTSYDDLKSGIQTKAGTMASGSIASFDFRANFSTTEELPNAYYTCIIRKYDNNSYVADIISNTGYDYKLSYAGNTWRMVALADHTEKYAIKTATVTKNGGTATVNWSEFGNMANNRSYTVLINGANVTWRYAGFLFLGGGSTAIVEVAKSYLSVTVNGSGITVTNTHPDYDQNINIEIMGNM